jgi:hypothetical protein
VVGEIRHENNLNKDIESALLPFDFEESGLWRSLLTSFESVIATTAGSKGNLIKYLSNKMFLLLTFICISV